MNHYECVITFTYQVTEWDTEKRYRRSDPILVDAQNPQLAKNFVRNHKLNGLIKDGESVKYIVARKVSTAYVMERLEQKRLL
jgi:hypothetical protein